MANNRMFLTHRSTGASVFLAKRMGGAWYTANPQLAVALEELFHYIFASGGLADEFVITLEDVEHAGEGAIEINYGTKEEGWVNIMKVEEVDKWNIPTEI